MSRLIIPAFAVLLAGCGNVGAPDQCPDPTLVAPASIGGAAFVRGLSGLLAGSDRENTITMAIAHMRRRDPAIDSDTLINVLVAADCPNAAARPDHSPEAERAHIAALRAQVDQLLSD